MAAQNYPIDYPLPLEMTPFINAHAIAVDNANPPLPVDESTQDAIEADLYPNSEFTVDGKTLIKKLTGVGHRDNMPLDFPLPNIFVGGANIDKECSILSNIKRNRCHFGMTFTPEQLDTSNYNRGESQDITIKKHNNAMTCRNLRAIQNISNCRSVSGRNINDVARNYLNGGPITGHEVDTVKNHIKEINRLSNVAFNNLRESKISYEQKQLPNQNDHFTREYLNDQIIKDIEELTSGGGVHASGVDPIYSNCSRCSSYKPLKNGTSLCDTCYWMNKAEEVPDEFASDIRQGKVSIHITGLFSKGLFSKLPKDIQKQYFNILSKELELGLDLDSEVEDESLEPHQSVSVAFSLGDIVKIKKGNQNAGHEATIIGFENEGYVKVHVNEKKQNMKIRQRQLEKLGKRKKSRKRKMSKKMSKKMSRK